MRKRIAAGQWPGIVSAQRSGKQGVKEFCQKENICITSFYDWRKRLSRSGVGRGFMRVKVSAPVIRQSKEQSVTSVVFGSGFLSGVRIWAPNGYQIEAGGCDEDVLRRVLGVLRTV